MKRRGFTLIELMVVIAIIIILAAIAIPNYLSMTLRAKKSRIASEFATLAIALESYNTDWGTYPSTGTTALALNGTSRINAELDGVTAAAGKLNTTGQATSTGEGAPIVYIQTGSLAQMVNPLVNLAAGNNHWYYYATKVAADANATSWVLYAYDAVTYYYRTSTNGTLQQASGAPAAP